jgi:nicotinamidase-related amidase
MPVIQALGEGYEVYNVTDASGGVSVEAHEMAIMRMVQAGAVPITFTVFASELQRDWARTATVPTVAEMMINHMGNVGTSFAWELQLLATAGAK